MLHSPSGGGGGQVIDCSAREGMLKNTTFRSWLDQFSWAILGARLFSDGVKKLDGWVVGHHLCESGIIIESCHNHPRDGGAGAWAGGLQH